MGCGCKGTKVTPKVTPKVNESGNNQTKIVISAKSK